MIEIHLDGKTVTKLEAARSVAKPDGRSVDIGEPNAEGWLEDYVTVYARRLGIEEISPPGVHWASYVSKSAADAKVFAGMIALGAEIAELAEMIAAEQVTEFTTSSLGASSAPCTQPEQHHPNLGGAAVDCDVAGHHGPARITEAAVDKAMAATLGWCPAATGPDEELDRALYCDKQLGEDNKHAGSHHAHVGDGSEAVWGDENDPYIRKGTRFPLAGTEPKLCEYCDVEPATEGKYCAECAPAAELAAAPRQDEAAADLCRKPEEHPLSPKWPTPMKFCPVPSHHDAPASAPNPPHYVPPGTGERCRAQRADGGGMCTAQPGHDGPEHVVYGTGGRELSRFQVDALRLARQQTRARRG